MNWEAAARRRQRGNSLAVLALASTMTYLMYLFFGLYGMPDWVLGLFLFAYFCFTLFTLSNFFMLFYGFRTALRGVKTDPYHPIHQALDPDPETRIAVIYPVYEEDMRRVGAGMAATWADLESHDPEMAEHFDFYVLSDSRDVDNVVQEEAITHEIAERYTNGRFHYRRRGVNLNTKQGNIADFCRRWGKHYHYMVVMDADSIMRGKELVRMARIMEGRPEIGIIQSQPSLVLRKTLFARMTQFMNSLVSKLFAYGQHYVLLGHGYYIGHNAIIRIEPFIKHCALPTLSGSRPWGGKPLSHDYIEATLMVGAGYEVWMLPELQSFEEFPPNLIDALKREQRWMQGNFQYLRVVMSEKIIGLHKYLLINGAMVYFAPLFGWVFFMFAAGGMMYFLNNPHALFSALNVASRIRVTAWCLFGLTLFIFVGPFLLALLLRTLEDKCRQFGGVIKVIWSFLLTFGMELLKGPAYMAFMSFFVFKWAKGEKVSWGSQDRSDRSVSWVESFSNFWWVSLIGVITAIVIFRFIHGVNTGGLLAFVDMRKYDLLWWYVPMLSGLILSVWMVRFTSMEYPVLERMGWFCSPEEIDPPSVVTHTNRLQESLAQRIPADYGFVDAVTDPWFFHRHLHRTRDKPERNRHLVSALENADHLYDLDLSNREKIAVLSERHLFEMFHWFYWC